MRHIPIERLKSRERMAKEAGQAAFARGSMTTSCPYRALHMKRAWLEGYYEAAKAANQEKN